MPRITANALRGYLLEEALAYLVRSSGYELLSTPEQDPDSLDWKGNGLVVKGRGGVHQVDVLGDLDWTPAFTFPLRLFLEAKFRGSTTGIGDVRNAIGVLADLNQSFTPSTDGTLQRRFRYAYALCSTSGFSKFATKMAYAHEISLLDLGVSEFRPLLEEIRQASERIIALPGLIRETMGEGEIDEAEDEDTPGLSLPVRQVRAFLRGELGHVTEAEPLDLDVVDSLRDPLSGVLQRVREYDRLFIGMGRGPQMLLLTAVDPEAFIERMVRKPVMRVAIRWSDSNRNRLDWTLQPIDESSNLGLHFRLPSVVAEYVFQSDSKASARARAFKSLFLPHISIPYRGEDGVSRIFRLDYEPTTPLP